MAQDADGGAFDEEVAPAGFPMTDGFGMASFGEPVAAGPVAVQVCTGLSCRLAGAETLLDAAHECGLVVEHSSCQASCDRAPVMARDHETLVEVSAADIKRSRGDRGALDSAEAPLSKGWSGRVWPTTGPLESCVFNLAAAPDWSARASILARKMGADAVIEAIQQSGLQGRGGAGFPAAVKWKAVRGQVELKRYVVLNADEAEPGTFKDRELLLRRPDLVLEGLAIAARVVGASEIFLYLRAAFQEPKRVLEESLERAKNAGLYSELKFHVHVGHGGYICGEETALLESLEGKREQPREKPPYPTESGLWGKPTLIQNVETIACVPAILLRGAAWFRELGRTQPGTKLYCISGHVAQPGVYELPLGVSLDELVEAAGGYIGRLKAFSPGGASSGFLPASERKRPLDFHALAEVGCMLGSAGVVVLNESVDMAWAAAEQLEFFERESCGKCSACRIGTSYQRHLLSGYMAKRRTQEGQDSLARVDKVAEDMREGSICGLGQTASLPLTSALRHFPNDFE
ncbi:MAG: NADH:ubiquinone oxidoreductase subunit F (NADH-binding) [Candidatus Paceibacteria bacterium]|jgi:NADH:ubiquinone oxidoreductase subunit F (NADH-binding)